jgi:hypothetical protein
MRQTLFFTWLIMCISYNSQAQKTRQPDTSGGYFTLKLMKGDTLANVYARTIAYTGDEFLPVVYRVSGSSTYEVVDNNGSNVVFNETDHYDGQPESKAVAIIGLSGTNSYNGKTFINSSASGLLYSELIWGPIRGELQEGDSWQHTISQPWELGGPGVQVITVIALDKANETITLQREGHSKGFFDGDLQQLNVTTKNDKKLKMEITPGPAWWTGYTTFKNGVVISDELLVSRNIMLFADGLHLSGHQREYILLNAMPHKSLHQP